MGIVISLILIALGAILTWGVHASSSSIDVDVVGVVLMIVGFVVFLISLVLWRTWWGAGFWAGWYGEPAGAPAVRRRVYRPYRRRATYVEEEPPPPARSVGDPAERETLVGLTGGPQKVPSGISSITDAAFDGGRRRRS